MPLLGPQGPINDLLDLKLHQYWAPKAQYQCHGVWTEGLDAFIEMNLNSHQVISKGARDTSCGSIRPYQGLIVTTLHHTSAPTGHQCQLFLTCGFDITLGALGPKSKALQLKLRILLQLRLGAPGPKQQPYNVILEFISSFMIGAQAPITRLIRAYYWACRAQQ